MQQDKKKRYPNETTSTGSTKKETFHTISNKDDAAQHEKSASWGLLTFVQGDMANSH